MSGVRVVTGLYNTPRSGSFVSSVYTHYSRRSCLSIPLQSRFLSSQYLSTKMSSPDITLYTAQTPNGIKISIALEELGYVSDILAAWQPIPLD